MRAKTPSGRRRGVLWLRILLVALTAAITACSSLGYKVVEPKFEPYQAILGGSRIWSAGLFAVRSSVWRSPRIVGVHRRTHRRQQLMIRDARAGIGTYISPYTSPGLWDLLEQVDKHNDMLVKAGSRREARIFGALQSRYKGREFHRAMITELSIAKKNQDPLPPSIAHLAVTKAYVVAIAAAYCNAARQAAVNAFTATRGSAAIPASFPGMYDARTSGILTKALTVSDFEEFGVKVIQANLALVEDPSRSDALVSSLAPVSHSKGISFASLMAQYFSAYYQGNFVDRDGGVLSKPALGRTISDSTLSDAATVALDAIFDFAVINDAAPGNEESAIKAPVVFDDSTGTVKWQTANGKEPTLAKVVQTLSQNSGSLISVRRESGAIATKEYTSFEVKLIGDPTRGTFTISVAGKTTVKIPFDAKPSRVERAIRGIGTKIVHGALVSGKPGGPYAIVLPNGLKATMTADGADLGGASSVYDVELVGGPTGGTFRLRVHGSPTPRVPFNASADQLAAGIRSVEPIGSAVPEVTGHAGGPFKVTLPPLMSGVTLSAQPTDAAGLTGGAIVETRKFVLERMSKDGQKGVSPAKLKIIRYVEGAASDGAKGLSGLIMRTFGGVHIGVSAGLGLLGKVSIGDNNALAKLLEAIVGTGAGRTAEFYASQMLYSEGMRRSSGEFRVDPWVSSAPIKGTGETARE